MIRTLIRSFLENAGYGVLMAANVLNSPRAVAVSVALVKAFVRLREDLAGTRCRFRWPNRAP